MFIIAPTQRYLFRHIGVQQWDKPWRSIKPLRINKRYTRREISEQMGPRMSYIRSLMGQ